MNLNVTLLRVACQSKGQDFGELKSAFINDAQLISRTHLPGEPQKRGLEGV
jgi:hypothetical protein